MTPTQPSQAESARREIGKWLNEEQTAPIDRVALAQLCAGFDALARPQEVAAVGDHYCNKCGYIGSSAAHPGCDYDASQRLPVALPAEPACFMCHGTGKHSVAAAHLPGQPAPARMIVDCRQCAPAPKQGDAKDAERYRYMIDCDFQAGRKYLPTLNEADYKAKLRAKHDAAILASKATAAGEGK